MFFPESQITSGKRLRQVRGTIFTWFEPFLAKSLFSPCVFNILSRVKMRFFKKDSQTVKIVPRTCLNLFPLLVENRLEVF